MSVCQKFIFRARIFNHHLPFQQRNSIENVVMHNFLFAKSLNNPQTQTYKLIVKLILLNGFPFQFRLLTELTDLQYTYCITYE